MGKGRVENLIIPSSEKARENGRKGGIASGKAKRDKLTLREALLALLQMPADAEGNSGMTVMATILFKKALEGDVRAICEIRDSIGEKPTDKLQAQMQGGHVCEFRWIGEALSEARDRVARLRDISKYEEPLPKGKKQKSDEAASGYKDGSQLEAEMMALQKRMETMSGRIW